MATPVATTAEENKALVRRYIETWNRGDLQGMALFWAPEMVHHTRFGSHGYEAVINIVGEFMRAFPDLRFEIEDLVADGDRVASRMTAHGTHQDEYMGVPATGKQINCSVFGIARVADGKLVEHWGVTDELQLIEQIGLVPQEYLQAMA
ncbi:MAG: ester cyclase [Chloroflexi bacterium]|nr:ester cyclase [Acidobacteriota bacterium]MCA1587960.1 ester cyclase [Chloroflexota bacterium]MCA1719561.1 ester cyclase [Actinomycetota bacterium]